MRRDLFSQAPASRALKKVPPRERAPVAHRCSVCGGFAPYGKGLPHRGERVVYFCREHRPL